MTLKQLKTIYLRAYRRNRQLYDDLCSGRGKLMTALPLSDQERARLSEARKLIADCMCIVDEIMGPRLEKEVLRELHIKVDGR